MHFLANKYLNKSIHTARCSVLTVLALIITVSALSGCQRQDDASVETSVKPLSDADKKQAKAHYLNAQSYEAQGQLRPALIEARNTLYVDPNHVESAFLIAKLLLVVGDGYGANKQIDILLFDDQDNLDFLLVKIEALIKQNKYNSAVELINKINPPETIAGKIEFYDLETEALAGANEHASAIKSAKKVLAIDEDNTVALVRIAQAYFQLGKNKASNEYTELARASGGDELELWLWVGKLALLKEDFAGGEEAYSKALSHVQKLDILTADKYLALNGMVKSLGGQGRTSAADIFAKQLQNSHFGELTDSYKNAINSFQDGKFTDAEQAFKEILEEAPRHAASGTALGMLKYSQGELKEAEAYLEEALKGNFVPVHTHKLLAVTRLKLEQGEDALTIINSALVEHPIDDELLALRGTALFMLKRLDEAKEAFQKALIINPLNPAALYTMGSIQAEQKNWEEAGEFHLKAARVNPDNLFALRGLVAAKDSMKDVNGAVVLLEDLALKFPKAFGPQLLLAVVKSQLNDVEGGYLHAKRAHMIVENKETVAMFSRLTLTKSIKLAQEKKWNDARKVALEARKLYPAALPITHHLVKIKMAEGSVTQAVEYVDWYITQYPQSADAWSLKGDIYAANSRVSEAIESYENSWEIKKTSVLGMKLFRSKSSLSNSESGLKDLQQWKKEQPKLPAARLTLAMAYQEANDKPKAIMEYEELSTDFPKHPLVLNNLAWLYHETKNSKAIETAELAYEMAPKSPAIADTYGWILVSNGKAKQAVPILQKASRAAPNNEEILNHYIQALEKSGDSAGAAAARQIQSTP